MSTTINKPDKGKSVGKEKGGRAQSAYGKQKRCYIPKEDANSPNISLVAIFTSIIIETRKVTDMDIFDVPRAYLKVDITEEKLIILKIEGEFVDIMCEVNSDHRKIL